MSDPSGTCGRDVHRRCYTIGGRSNCARVTTVTAIGIKAEPIPGVSGRLVVNAVLDAHPRTRVVWPPKRADLIEFLARELRAGDVSISMGCGDVATLPDEVLARRAELLASSVT